MMTKIEFTPVEAALFNATLEARKEVSEHDVEGLWASIRYEGGGVYSAEVAFMRGSHLPRIATGGSSVSTGLHALSPNAVTDAAKLAGGERIRNLPLLDMETRFGDTKPAIDTGFVYIAGKNAAIRWTVFALGDGSGVGYQSDVHGRHVGPFAVSAHDIAGRAWPPSSG
ncbi:MAG: hypothetical protein VR70_03950 [Rhodospirillaceae bacterium BRH_c57]|nr:MAG: hypothetical protein VR70_03950 [Rhodospirillaceae bacterium BRH_c57]